MVLRSLLKPLKKQVMKTVKSITEKYEGNNFGVEIIRDKVLRKKISIKSWWGLGDTYEQLCSELRREGYTLSK